jgi:hypothetical protein
LTAVAVEGQTVAVTNRSEVFGWGAGADLRAGCGLGIQVDGAARAIFAEGDEVFALAGLSVGQLAVVAPFCVDFAAGGGASGGVAVQGVAFDFEDLTLLAVAKLGADALALKGQAATGVGGASISLRRNAGVSGRGASVGLRRNSSVTSGSAGVGSAGVLGESGRGAEHGGE